MSKQSSNSIYQAFDVSSQLFGMNALYLEEMYAKFLVDPNSVEQSLRSYFEGLEAVSSAGGSSTTQAHTAGGLKQVAVFKLITAYRTVGSRLADLDPLKLNRQEAEMPDLSLSSFGLAESDLDTVFDTSETFFGPASMSLRDLVKALQQTYCATLAVEYMHISDCAQKTWWQQRFESCYARPAFSIDKKKNILERLTAAEGLEQYLHTKYVGVKRFSLEGGESFMVAMGEVICHGAAVGIKDVVIGMAHRGRLNVLVNTLCRPPKELFAEFDHTAAEPLVSGDVKYHQGYSSNLQTPAGKIHASLMYNPSHLEVVNPVVSGSSRARMEMRGDLEGKEVLPVQVHGDSAFTGQGVVQETLSQSKARSYSVGGTLHIVINNQVGFTTSDLRDMRSSWFCTDALKMVEAPVLHVNADDPEAVAFATQMALDYRLEFGLDIGLDIVCFRKLGHNEQDTPAITQPLMYKSVTKHPGTRRLYADKLAAEGLGDKIGEEMAKAYRAALDKNKLVVNIQTSNNPNGGMVDWSRYIKATAKAVGTETHNTTISQKQWKQLAEKISTIPESITAHLLIKKIYGDRAAMGRGDSKVDWGMAENMAYASLVSAGYPVRLSGEDCGRGTFSHRQSVVHNQDRQKWDEDGYVPLNNIDPKQAKYTVIDSTLSENGVLGFEFGFASSAPKGLVIWEGQFGDFANGAQIMIDQFITSAEVKWGNLCGLVMLLPHGQEGQGPEHSSARLERYLQLAGNGTVQICQPTTSAQIFHLLRKQALSDVRRPLIVMSPKSLLRHKDAACDVSEFTSGPGFQPILAEQEDSIIKKAAKVKRVVVCSGKVYYELAKKRTEAGIEDVAIIRVEQLYPFPRKAFAAELNRYSSATEVVWCQDEPQNQGSWFHVRCLLQEAMSSKQKLGYSGRPESAAPAVGYSHLYQDQQKTLIEGAFGVFKEPAVIG